MRKVFSRPGAARFGGARGWLRRLVAVLSMAFIGSGLVLAGGEPQGPPLQPSGWSTAAAVALVGWVTVGAGTAGLLLLRALARWREGRRGEMAGQDDWRFVGRACVESGFLGVTACSLGLFLLAFVGLATRPEPETVLLPVLSSLMIVDGRALILAFVAVAALLLTWTGSSTLRAALESWQAPVAVAVRSRSRSGGWRLRVLLAFIPSSVALGVLMSTSWGVQRVLALVAEGAGPSMPPPVLVQMPGVARPAGLWRVVPLSALPSLLPAGAGASWPGVSGAADAPDGGAGMWKAPPVDLPAGDPSRESPSAS